MKKLVEPLHNFGRNITCDQYFSNYLTVVGTIVSNQKHLPVELIKKAGHLVGSTLFAFKDDLTVCFWVPEKNTLAFFTNHSSI